MKVIPLFGTGVQAYSASATAQRRLNVFYDPRADGDATAAYLRGTPGTVAWVTLPLPNIRGFYVANNTLFVVASQVLYAVSSAGAITSLGVLSTSSGRVEFADNGIQIALVDGTKGYYYTWGTATFGTITDANFPAGATTICAIDSYFIVEHAGTRTFYVSQILDATLWTPATFGTKEQDSSFLSAVDTLNGNLVLFGHGGIEFWQDVGAAGLPFQRVNGATQTWGLVAKDSRVEFMNSLAFLANNPQGQAQVCMFVGYVPTPISTPDIDNIVSQFETVSDAVALTYMIDGHAMYQITFPSGGRSFLYDGLTQIWSEVQTGLAVQARHYGNYGIAFNSGNYISDHSTGNIYRVDASVYTDNGTAIKRQVRTRHVKHEGNIFGVPELWLDMETGVGLQSGQGSDPEIMLSVSKDGGRTFGMPRFLRIGAVGQYRTPRVVARRWGQARDFVWDIVMSDPVKFVINGAAVTAMLQEGTET